MTARSKPLGYVRERPSSPRWRLSPLSSMGREALAFARQAALIHRDWLPDRPAAVASGEDVVVVLHGLFASAGVLRPLRATIERSTSAHTASFTYSPNAGIHDVAERLGELIARLPSGARVHLVGHSVGGLAARWFVQELSASHEIVQTISMGSPFHGTRHARLWPAQAGRDILPSSFVLRRLRGGGAAHIPHFSIVAAHDRLVPQGAALPGRPSWVAEGCGHNGLLYDQRVWQVVVSRVKERCWRAAG